MLIHKNIHFSEWRSIKNFEFLDGFISKNGEGRAIVLNCTDLADNDTMLLNDGKIVILSEAEAMFELYKSYSKNKFLIYDGEVNGYNVSVMYGEENNKDEVLISFKNMKGVLFQ